jgi:hypothetical protein
MPENFFMPENDDEPEIVYHYTTMGTMMKIAEQASIWATSINYLNDISEGDYFQELVRKRIPEYRTTRQVDDPSIFDDFLNTPANPANERIEYRPFVASFSLNGDSLPQWRSYCPNGNGVAVGFRVDCLQRCIVKTAGEEVAPSRKGARFVEVEYVDEPTPESLDGEIESAIAWIKSATPQKGVTDGQKFRFIMQRLACSKKHPSFSNEREFRLILDGVYQNTNWIEFRTARSTLVPYVSLSIPVKATSTLKFGGSDFIDHVIVGPSPNMDLSQSAVWTYFQKLKIDIEVGQSKAPYREW